MQPHFKIGDELIKKESSDLFFISEIGVNFYDIAVKLKISPMEAAKHMIKEAAKAGSHAVKFQAYKAHKLASKHSPAYWDTTKEPCRSQYELFKKFDTLNDNDFRELANECQKNNVYFLATPFDEEAVDALDSILLAYKIASADITNKNLIKKIVAKKKPVILSTGASNIEEIKQAGQWITEGGHKGLAILHCVLSYPTQPKDANLGMIRNLNRTFGDFVVGYSDHVPPDSRSDVLIAAFLLGANIIEKHFTLDKTLTGNDHYHAFDPQDLKRFFERVKFIKEIYGDDFKKVIAAERNSRKFARRSIVAAQFIPQGTQIAERMITSKRPGTGISLIFWHDVVGKYASKDIQEDEIIEWAKLK